MDVRVHEVKKLSSEIVAAGRKDEESNQGSNSRKALKRKNNLLTIFERERKRPFTCSKNTLPLYTIKKAKTKVARSSENKMEFFSRTSFENFLVLQKTCNRADVCQNSVCELSYIMDSKIGYGLKCYPKYPYCVLCLMKKYTVFLYSKMEKVVYNPYTEDACVISKQPFGFKIGNLNFLNSWTFKPSSSMPLQSPFLKYNRYLFRYDGVNKIIFTPFYPFLHPLFKELVFSCLIANVDSTAIEKSLKAARVPLTTREFISSYVQCLPLSVFEGGSSRVIPYALQFQHDDKINDLVKSTFGMGPPMRNFKECKNTKKLKATFAPPPCKGAKHYYSFPCSLKRSDRTLMISNFAYCEKCMKPKVHVSSTKSCAFAQGYKHVHTTECGQVLCKHDEDYLPIMRRINQNKFFFYGKKGFGRCSRCGHVTLLKTSSYEGNELICSGCTKAIANECGLCLGVNSTSSKTLYVFDDTNIGVSPAFRFHVLRICYRHTRTRNVLRSKLKDS